jgi:hypothetical protein
MPWLPALCLRLLERLISLPFGRSWRFRLTLAATVLPAILLLLGGPAGAGEPRCPRGEHASSGHCCPKGSDWTFFGCQELRRQSDQNNGESQDCPFGQERRAGACFNIECPIGQELRAGTCWPIQCPPGQELAGSVCIPQTTCPMGQTGSPPFCHY